MRRGRCGCGCCRWQLALAAVGITFGLLAVVGARLTIAAAAVLPILVGLAVDYAVQFQARVAEAELSAPGRGRAAVTIAAARGAPTLATAALATAVAFLALELSPVPMVEGFRSAAGGRGRGCARLCANGRGGGVGDLDRGAAGGAGGRLGGRGLGADARRSGACRRSAALAGSALAPSVRGAGELLGGAGKVLGMERARGRARALPARAVARGTSAVACAGGGVGAGGRGLGVRSARPLRRSSPSRD